MNVHNFDNIRPTVKTNNCVLNNCVIYRQSPTFSPISKRLFLLPVCNKLHESAFTQHGKDVIVLVYGSI